MYSPVEVEKKKELFLNRIEQGESMREICKDKNSPDDNTLYRWLNKDKQFREQYARAREQQALFYTEKIEKVIVELKNSGDYTREDIDVARLEIDSYKWVASKLLPKVYGTNQQQTNVQVNIAPVTGMQIIDITPEETKIPENQDPNSHYAED